MQQIRKEIDALDAQLKELLMKRMDCSLGVAQAKNAEGSTQIFRADREAEILERLGADVDPQRKAQYLAVVRKIMETSRMYQYGLLCQWNPDLFAQVPGHHHAAQPSTCVTVRLTRPDEPNGLAPVLAMIADYGFNLQSLWTICVWDGKATFDLVLQADASQPHTQQLLFQLFKETEGFRILHCQ